MDNYTQNKLDADAREQDDAPPMVMTHAKAQALLDAHERGQLMSDELLAEATLFLCADTIADAANSEWNSRPTITEYDEEDYDYQEYRRDVGDTY